MKHTKNRLLALLLVLAMAIGMLPFGALFVGAETLSAPAIEVDENGVIGNLTWEAAYVGSSYHQTNAWQVTATAWTDSYRLSSPVTVPKAGTTLVWSESAAAGAMSKNAFFLTSWKDANGTWTIDLSGTNLIADGKNSSNHQVYDEDADIMTYIYTTTRDNEILRFACYAKGVAADACPAVYAYTATFADGAVTGVKWFGGYVGSYANGETYVNKIRQTNTSYTYSMPIMIPKAGTTVSFADSTSGYCSGAAYAISTWVAGDDGRLELFYGCPGGDQESAWLTIADGVYTYSYTSTYDNEIIRLCYCNNNVVEDVAITYVEDNAANHRPILEAAGYDPDQTGTPYTFAGWKNGAISTLSNNAAFSDETYGYHLSDVIPVIGKGTTVTFTDVVSAEGALVEGVDGKSNFLGDQMYAIASFYGAAYTGLAADDDEVTSVDGTLANVKGDATVSIQGGKRVYSYTTTKDVEFLRLSLSNIGNFAAGGEETKTGFIPPIVYVSAPQADAYSEALEGLTVYALGDSYLEGNGIDRNDHWITQLGAKYDWNYINYGINGNPVSSYADANAMVNRYTAMADNADVDVIIFEGGRNDYNQSVPMGTVGESDPETFIGAVQIIIDGLLHKYPNAVILCMTPWDLSAMNTGSNKLNAAGNYTQDYAKAFTDYVNGLCNDRVRMLQNADPAVIPVHMTDAYYRTLYCQSATDISHFSGRGMDLVQPWFELAIGAQNKDYQKDLGNTGVYFSIDQLTYSFAATEADKTIYVPDSPWSERAAFLGWGGQINGESVVFYAGQAVELSATDAGELEPIYLQMDQVATPNIRFEAESTGLRFLTAVSLSDYTDAAALIEDTKTKISFGTLIVPQQYVVDMDGELTHASLSAADKQHLDVGCNVSNGTDWYASDDVKGLGYIAGSIASIKLKNYSKDFTAAGYAKMTFEDGTVRYIYAQGGGKSSAAVYDVAYDALHDRAIEYSGVYQYKDACGTYTPYTTQQLEILESFLDPVINLKTVSDTAIMVSASKYYTPSSFTMTAVKQNQAEFNALVNALGDDEVSVIYVIEATNGEALADGTYGGLLLDGYDCPPVYYQGKILVGMWEYSSYY